MDYATIIYDEANSVAKVTLNRPDRLNAFTVEMHREFGDALARAKASQSRVLLITGAGRGFCAGQDLGDRAVAPGRSVDLGDSLANFYNPLIRTITDMPMPVVAAVNGVAAGAGANIALACDIVIAARSAKFIQSFAQLGLVPDSGGTWVLPRLLGQARAIGLALTAEALRAEQAEAWGLIWKCVDDEKLAQEAGDLATRFASAPTRGLYAIKKLIRSGATRTLEEQLELERAAQSDLGKSNDYAEGVAAFMEKRAPRFVGQ